MKLGGVMMGLCRGRAAILSHAGQLVKAHGSGGFRGTLPTAAEGCLAGIHCRNFHSGLVLCSFQKVPKCKPTLCFGIVCWHLTACCKHDRGIVHSEAGCVCVLFNACWIYASPPMMPQKNWHHFKIIIILKRTKLNSMKFNSSGGKHHGFIIRLKIYVALPATRHTPTGCVVPQQVWLCANSKRRQTASVWEWTV